MVRKTRGGRKPLELELEDVKDVERVFEDLTASLFELCVEQMFDDLGWGKGDGLDRVSLEIDTVGIAEAMAFFGKRLPAFVRVVPVVVAPDHPSWAHV